MRISDWSSDVCSSDLPSSLCQCPRRDGSLRLERRVSHEVLVRPLRSMMLHSDAVLGPFLTLSVTPRRQCGVFGPDYGPSPEQGESASACRNGDLPCPKL